jgi:hypothetical protein
MRRCCEGEKAELSGTASPGLPTGRLRGVVNAANLPAELVPEGFTVSVEGEGIRVTPESQLTPKIRRAIAATRPELLAPLRWPVRASANLKTIKGNQKVNQSKPPGPDPFLTADVPIEAAVDLGIPAKKPDISGPLAAVSAIEAAADTPGRRRAAAAYSAAVGRLRESGDPYLMECAADLWRVADRWRAADAQMSHEKKGGRCHVTG